MRPIPASSDRRLPPTPSVRTRGVASAAALALVAAIGLGGCGGDDRDEAASAQGPQPSLVFPPTAYEPATSKGGGPTPAGRVVKLGGRPEGLAVDPASGLLGIALRDRAHGFAILDASTLEVRRTVPLLADPRHVAVANGRFLVPMEDANRLAEVPARGGEPRLTKVGREPHAVTAAGGRIVVADEYADSLSVLEDGRLVGTAVVDVQPGGVADVGGGQVAVVSVRANTISLVDLSTLRSGPSQSAGYGPSHAVAGDDGRVFVADTRGGAILTYETKPRLKAVARLDLGGSPYGLAIDVERRRLWVTDSGADELVEVSIDGEARKVGTKPTVQQPNTVAVDPRNGAVFIASNATGELQRVEP
ncbi:MAG: YncE family protein [Solirubrobacteraceae bacterium]|nr:YncE family protein [Solirubrobacteraceae bacterium]